jgi:hypothetical protein
MLARIARSSPLWRRKRRRSPSEPTRCGRRSWLLQQPGDSGLRAGGDHGDTAQADDIRCQSRRMRTSELPWRFRSSWRRSWWSGQVIRRSPGGCPRARFGSHPWSTPMVISTAARTNGSGARTADETRTARSASILTGIMDPCGGSSTPTSSHVPSDETYVGPRFLGAPRVVLRATHQDALKDASREAPQEASAGFGVTLDRSRLLALDDPKGQGPRR